MSTEERQLVARKILGALYEDWLRHRSASLQKLGEESGWDEKMLRSVLDQLEQPHGLIEVKGHWSDCEITPAGVEYAEEKRIVPEETTDLHRRSRMHALEVLARVHDESGKHAHEHFEKVAEGSPVDRFVMATNLKLLSDRGLVKSMSSSSYRITDEGMRFIRGDNYDDIV